MKPNIWEPVKDKDGIERNVSSPKGIVFKCPHPNCGFAAARAGVRCPHHPGRVTV